MTPAARPVASRRAWVLILLVALLVRVALIANMGGTYYFGDTAEYDRAARALLAGHGPGTDVPRAPLYPAFMALGYVIGGVGNFPAVRFLQLLLGLGIVVLTERLARRLAGPKPALFAMLAAAVAPTLVFTTGMLYPTALHTLLLLAATHLAGTLAKAPNQPRAIALGALFGLLWLTDPISIAPVVALVLWLAPSVRARLRRRVATLATVLAVTVLVPAPWMAWQSRAYGGGGVFFAKAQYVLHFSRSDSTIAGGRAIREAGPFRPLPARDLLSREWNYFRSRPAAYASDWGREFLHFFQPLPDRIQSSNRYTAGAVLWIGALFFTPVLLLALTGLVFGRAAWRERLLPAVPVLATAAIYSFFMTQTRYQVPVLPEMIGLAALGLARLVPALASRPVTEGRPRATPAETASAPIR